MLIFKEFTFDSAHFLPHVPDTHKCRGIHGHTYRLAVYLDGPVHPELGWVMDFAALKNIIGPVVDAVDHKLLNEVAGLENPTCELLAKWIWNQVKPSLPLLSRIKLFETPTSGVVYVGGE